MSRLARTLLLAAVAFCFVAPSVGAAAHRHLLIDFWSTVLETPAAENPFSTGDPTCFDVGGNTVVPLVPSPSSVQEFACTVKRGTKVFVAASTWECSTFAVWDHDGFGTTEDELRACARHYDAQVRPSVTLDEQRVPVSEIETGLLRIYLPMDNIFGVTGGDRNGQSVAHGWVVPLMHLAPGTHTIELDIAGKTTTTTIIVS